MLLEMPAGKRRLLPRKELEGCKDKVRLMDGESTYENRKATEVVDGAGTVRVVSRGSKFKKGQVQEDKKCGSVGSSTERGRTRTGCGRQAEKFRLGWRPGKNDLGCPVEKTGCVTMTMFRATSYCCMNNLDFGIYRACSSWHIPTFVAIILDRLNVFFHLYFSLCSISCANLSLVFFSTDFSSLSCANFGPKQVYSELSNICCSSGLKH